MLDLQNRCQNFGKNGADLWILLNDQYFFEFLLSGVGHFWTNPINLITLLFSKS